MPPFANAQALVPVALAVTLPEDVVDAPAHMAVDPSKDSMVALRVQVPTAPDVQLVGLKFVAPGTAAMNAIPMPPLGTEPVACCGSPRVKLSTPVTAPDPLFSPVINPPATAISATVDAETTTLPVDELMPVARYTVI
jgi:hypothetical protein